MPPRTLNSLFLQISPPFFSFGPPLFLSSPTPSSFSNTKLHVFLGGLWGNHYCSIFYSDLKSWIIVSSDFTVVDLF